MVDEIVIEFYDKEYHSGYDFVHSINYEPKNDDEFRLHAHDDRYEIVLFLSGDDEFHIEGNKYPSTPHSLYIAWPFEMHQNVFLSPQQYERIVIHLRL